MAQVFALGVCHQFNRSIPIGHSFREGKLFRTQFTCRVAGKAKSASGNWTFFSLFSLLKVCTNRACKLTFPSPSRGNELSFSGGPQFLPDDHSSTGPLHSQAEDTLMNVNLPPPHRVLPVNFSDDKFPRSCMSHSLQKSACFFCKFSFQDIFHFDSSPNHPLPPTPPWEPYHRKPSMGKVNEQDLSDFGWVLERHLHRKERGARETKNHPRRWSPWLSSPSNRTITPSPKGSRRPKGACS